MIDHTALNLPDFDLGLTFFKQVLPTLHFECVLEFENSAAFGRNGVPTFWLRGGGTGSQGKPIRFQATHPQQIEAFRDAALAAGAAPMEPACDPPVHPQSRSAHVQTPCGCRIQAVYLP